MELDEIRHLLDQFVSYNQTITNRISQARQEADKSQHHIDQQQKHLAALTQNRSRLYQEVQSVSQQQELNRRKIASLRMRIVAAEVECGRLENQLREFETRSEDLVLDMADRSSQIDAWKERARKYDSDQPEHKELEGLRQSIQRLERRQNALKKHLEGGGRGMGRGQKLGQEVTGTKTILELGQDKLRLQLKREKVLRERNSKKASHEDLHRQLAALRTDQRIYEDRNRQVRDQLRRQVNHLRFQRTCLLQERGALGTDDVPAAAVDGRESDRRSDDHGAVMTALDGDGQWC